MVLFLGMFDGHEAHAAATTSPAGNGVVAQSKNNDSVSYEHRPQTRDEVFKTFKNMTEVGEKMFMDPALSGSGKLACASCHSPSRAFGPPNALSVPLNAVVVSTERKYVIVVRNGKTVKVDVTTGNQNAGRVEIIGALKAGETVIAPANDEIKEGVGL